MVSAYRAQFDYIVLKPIWLTMLCWAGYSLYDRAWLTALFWVVMSEAISYIGGSLHKGELSFKELAAGTPSLSDVAASDPVGPSYEDSHAVTLSCIRVSFIIGVITSVFAAHSHGWIFSVLLGFGVWGLGIFVITILFGLLARLYVIGRLRSIPPGLFLFWLGVCALVVPIIFVVRIFN